MAVRVPLTTQVFDWDDAQPHRFRTADGPLPAENEDAVLLLDVARPGRETLWYDYGSGDPPWQHRLDVVSAVATTQPVPRCEAGGGTRPREVGPSPREENLGRPVLISSSQMPADAGCSQERGPGRADEASDVGRAPQPWQTSGPASTLARLNAILMLLFQSTVH